MTTFSHLPVEIKLRILRYTNALQLLEYRLINKELSNICKNDRLWKRLVEVDYGDVPMVSCYYDTYKFHHLNRTVYDVIHTEYDEDGMHHINTVSVCKSLTAALVSIVFHLVQNYRFTLLDRYSVKGIYDIFDWFRTNKRVNTAPKAVKDFIRIVINDLNSDVENEEGNLLYSPISMVHYSVVKIKIDYNPPADFFD